MRTHLGWIVALLLCLFVVQAAVAVTSAHSGCCIEGCEGVANCTSPGCAACSVPVAPPVAGLAGHRPAKPGEVVERIWLPRAGPAVEVWRPPD